MQTHLTARHFFNLHLWKWRGKKSNLIASLIDLSFLFSDIYTQRGHLYHRGAFRLFLRSVPHRTGDLLLINDGHTHSDLSMLLRSYRLSMPSSLSMQSPNQSAEDWTEIKYFPVHDWQLMYRICALISSLSTVSLTQGRSEGQAKMPFLSSMPWQHVKYRFI